MFTQYVHAIHSHSAYARVLSEEPLFTTYTRGFVGTIDYIFCSCNLTPLQARTWRVAPMEGSCNDLSADAGGAD